MFLGCHVVVYPISDWSDKQCYHKQKKKEKKSKTWDMKGLILQREWEAWKLEEMKMSVMLLDMNFDSGLALLPLLLVHEEIVGVILIPHYGLSFGKGALNNQARVFLSLRWKKDQSWKIGKHKNQTGNLKQRPKVFVLGHGSPKVAIWTKQYNRKCSWLISTTHV